MKVKQTHAEGIEESAAVDIQVAYRQYTIFMPAIAKQRLEKEIELLRYENESLDAKIQEHELAIGAGAFNPATSRVLELKDSPASRHQAVRQHMLDSLKEENTALLEAIAQVQQQQQQQSLQTLRTNENGDQEVALRDESMIPTASYNRLKEDHTRLQEEMAEKAKLSKRLKQVCSRQLRESKPSLCYCSETCSKHLVHDIFFRSGRSRPRNSWRLYGPCWVTSSRSMTVVGSS